MSNLVTHPYHIVDESPWPLYGSVGGIYLTTGLIKWFHLGSLDLMISGLLLLFLVMYQWWRDIIREGFMQGLHTAVVQMGLRSGMILFIISEVFFFLSFFWAYFHFSLAPEVELGGVWPYLGIKVFNPMSVPLLNTNILLSSGISVTWAHHALIEGNASEMTAGLLITIILGLYFTFLQYLEYLEAEFSFSDGVYGSSFFIATGFHGLHVIIGTTFLLVCLIRHVRSEFSPLHHFGFEAAVWYWHFVDVVWLYLYMAIYWWGGV